MSFQQILVAIDFGATVAELLHHAEEEARLHQAQLTLLHVFDTQIMDLQLPEELLPNSLEMLQRLRGLAQERLESLQKSLSLATDAVLLEKSGNIGRNICDYASEKGFDLIIVGSQDQGAIGRLLLGSVATSVVHHAACPVLVYKNSAKA